MFVTAMLRASCLFKKPDWLKKIECHQRSEVQVAVVARGSSTEAKIVVKKKAPLGLFSNSAVAHTVGCRKGQGSVLLSVNYHLVKHRQ